MTLKTKVLAKDAKMGKFHHTEAKKGEKLSICYAFYSSKDGKFKKKKATASHRPKLCAIETSRDSGTGAHGGVSESSQL